jgi:hypothetical protein
MSNHANQSRNMNNHSILTTSESLPWLLCIEFHPALSCSDLCAGLPAWEPHPWHQCLAKWPWIPTWSVCTLDLCLNMGSNLRSPSKLSAFGFYHTCHFNIILKTISLMSISFLFTFLCHYIVTLFLHLLFTKIMTSITKTGIHQAPSTMPWQLSYTKKFYFL